MHADLETRIARQCETLIYRAARFTDLARWEELAALFMEDGTLVRPSDPVHPVVGRAAILASLQARPPRVGRHLLTNVIVDVHSATSAHVSSTVSLFLGTVPALGATSPTPARVTKLLIGHFEDDVTLVGPAWAFARRDGSMVLEFESAR